ncbi:hypothetical protein ACFX2K_035010 [Malus domestica]
MGFDLLVGFLHSDLFMGFLENNRLLLRKSFRAYPSRGPVVIPNIDLGCLELMSRSGVSIKGKKAVMLAEVTLLDYQFHYCF